MRVCKHPRKEAWMRACGGDTWVPVPLWAQADKSWCGCLSPSWLPESCCGALQRSTFCSAEISTQERQVQTQDPVSASHLVVSVSHSWTHLLPILANVVLVDSHISLSCHFCIFVKVGHLVANHYTIFRGTKQSPPVSNLRAALRIPDLVREQGLCRSR